MTVYNNYLHIPHDTFNNWKLATRSNSYVVDNTKPLCWNYISELWYNVGFPTGYPLMGVSDFPAEIWILNKEANKAYNGNNYFNLVYTKEDIKQGDVLVFSGLGNSSDIVIATEAYNSSNPDYIGCLVQGFQGSPYVSQLNSYPLADFIGGFRYTAWNATPPTPPTPTSTVKKPFPWVLYAKRLRNRK